MVRIAPFAVEQWMDEYETTPGVLNVAETCAASVSIDDLVGITEDTKLVAEDIVVTQGAIGANFLALYSLIGPNDHVVCVYPTYQQLYEVPRSIGAEVSLWKLKEEESFVPNVDELINLIRKNTKVNILKRELGRIAQIAKEKGIILFSDEVYRPLFHGGASGKIDIPKSAMTLGYERTITTGSMSKGYALAGIRVGWIASKDKSIISAIMAARDYTTISVSQIDDQVARYALSPAVLPSLVDRNLTLARNNAKLVKEFIERYKTVCSWVEPMAGTTAFVRFIKNGQPINDVNFCLDLLSKNNVLFVAGSKCFGNDEDFKGYIRMGYVCETHVLVED
ncbi:aspartate aminotransferase [Fusarium acutatum]|uniref:Aspartate aminotransferase n=1 Tax=Fusarium acutatum TaxID=78861 RepID=A0A8H4K1W2_9HYPO|nr:aspartate aminotransferase [Fusarium acutatum]